jgi:hypothetical protein
VIFYPSKVGNTLNGRPYRPEWVCGRAMLNPNYGHVRLLRPVPVMCDSGAFQDIDKGVRLLPWTALSRQLAMERAIAVGLGQDDWHFEALVIYDQMLGVDEQIVNGQKIKRRGNEETARPAIAETLRAARYYAGQRARIRGRICFVGQGATPRQYVQECVIPMLDVMRPGDWFAFGGFCIIGRVPSLKPLFVETVAAVLPLLKALGITRAHLLGIGVTDMVRYAAEQGRQYGIAMSTDTSAVETRSVHGYVFDGWEWHKRWEKADKLVNYHPRDLAEANLLFYDAFCRSLAGRDAAPSGYTRSVPPRPPWRSAEDAA